MASWSFLTSHARVLLYIAHDPGVGLRDIAASVGITERSAYGIVTDLTEAGYVVKQKDGRRNGYQIQAHLPLPEPASQESAPGPPHLDTSSPPRHFVAEHAPVIAAHPDWMRAVPADQLPDQDRPRTW